MTNAVPERRPVARSARRSAGISVVATAAMVLWSLLAAGCSGSSSPTAGDLADRSEPTVAPTTVSDAEDDPAAGETAATTTPSATATDTPSGISAEDGASAEAGPNPVPGWAVGLRTGDCFDSADPGEPGTVAGPVVPCDGDHEYELFHLGELDAPPDAGYPIDGEYAASLFADICAPAVIEFAGAAHDRLPFPTTLWTPSEEQWSAGDRTVGCTAEAGIRDDDIHKVGTAAAASLLTDEGVVARSTVDGRTDFYFSYQGSTLHPLTDGSFDLPRLSPEPLATGFLFASAHRDGDELGVPAYSFDYASGATTPLATGLDGYELASPHFAPDVPAFVFAARADVGDDWELYVARSADDVVALTDNDVDDHLPTLTPDGSRVVYSSDGDLWIMDLDGSDPTQLTSGDARDGESDVSPDGSLIVYTSRRSGRDDVWIMNIDGSDPRNLTDHPADDEWPFFSADGDLVYFQTDRLGVTSNLMLVPVEGGEPAYYSYEFMTNAALLPDSVTQRWAAELPTLAEVLESPEGAADGFEEAPSVVPGAPGERSRVEHRSARIQTPLPGGWEYRELDVDADHGEVAVLLAAPSIEAYRTSWAADGVLMTVIEADGDEFDALLDEVPAATDESCLRVGDAVETDGTRTTIRRRYTCGSAGTAIVIGTHDSSTGTGLVFEGQWDGEPDDLADRNLIMAIAQAVRWR